MRARGTERKKRREMGRDKPYEEERERERMTVDGGDSSQYSQSREKGENARETGETRGRAAGITDKRGESQFDVNRV